MGTTQRMAALGALVVMPTAAFVFIVYAPAALGLALSVGAALAWCQWLDRSQRRS